MRSIKNTFDIIFPALLLVVLATPAAALSVGVSVSLGPSNSADAIGTSGSNRFQVASSAGVLGALPGPVADTAGANLAFDARYAALVAADREAGGGTTTQGATASWTISFTVDNPTGGIYQVDIDTSRLGALTLVSDGGGDASATLGAITGTVDGSAHAELALAAFGPTAGSAGANSAFSQAGSTLSLVDTALSRTFVLAFSWTMNTVSTQDEAAVRMGLAGGLGTTTADDYPGVGARTLGTDGHFVHVGVTLLAVPEPGTFVLLVLGLFGLARCGRRPSVAAVPREG